MNNSRLINKTYNRGFGIVFGYNLRSVTTTSNQLCLRRESLLSNHFCDFDFNQYFFQADLDSWQKDKGYQGSRFIIVLHKLSCLWIRHMRTTEYFFTLGKGQSVTKMNFNVTKNFVLKWRIFFLFKNSILLFCDNVIMSFSGLRGAAFDGEKNGRLYLTTHRMVFNNKGTKDEMKSFSFPFVALRNVELEQPVFGANYIKGKVLAQPNGGFEGEAKFKLRFKSGGAIGKFKCIV